MEEKEDCYINLIARLDGLEVQLGRVGEQLRELKSFLTPGATETALDVVREICLDSLFDVKPKGDT
jgi:hypothetical protein